MSKSIKISKKHGLNPSMLVCPICGEVTKEIALFGKLKGDVEAPMYSVSNNFCDNCKEHMVEYLAVIPVKSQIHNSHELLTNRVPNKGFIWMERSSAHDLFGCNEKTPFITVDEELFDRITGAVHEETK